MIFHVDVSKDNNDNEYIPGQDPTDHYMVRVIQARDPFKLESAPWHNNFNQNGWWNSGPTLSDFSEDYSLLPYYELNRGSNCLSTGNTFSNFRRVSTTANYQFDYATDLRRLCSSPPGTDIVATGSPNPTPTRSPVPTPTRSPAPDPTKAPSQGPGEAEGIPEFRFRAQWFNRRRKLRFRWNKGPINTRTVRLLRNGRVIRRTANDGLFVLSIRPKKGGKIPFQLCENKANPRCSVTIYR